MLPVCGNLKNKYKELSAPVKASIWFVFCGFLQKGIAMLTTPVFTRIMTTTEFGRYNVYNTWFNFVQIVITLSLAAGVFVKGLVAHEDDQDEFSSSLLGLSTVCIAISAVIYAGTHKWLNNLTGFNTLLGVSMLVEIWATAAFQFWSARERVNYKYKKLVAITAVYVLLRPLLGIVCVLAVKESLQVEARAVSAAAVNLVVFLPLFITIMRKGKRFFHRAYWSYAVKFNLPLIPHYLSQIILNQSDKVMIDKICGAAETAYYSVAYAIASVLQILNSSISAAMSPWIYRSIRDNEEDKIEPVANKILILIALLNLLIIAVAPEFLWIMAPASYGKAVWVIPPVTISVYFMFAYNLYSTVEFYFNEPKYVTYVTVISAALNITLNAWFIPIYGFVAAAYTTLFCYFLCAVAHYLLMSKVCREFMGEKKIFNWKIMFAIGAALVVTSVSMAALYDHLLIRYAIVIAMMVFTALKREEIIAVWSIMQKR